MESRRPVQADWRAVRCLDRPDAATGDFRLPGLAAVKAPMLTVCPLKVRSVLTLSAEIE